ncbi:MAG: hypothetical protein JWO00_140 [Candidatus Parcubacteria bacterium]|nr:hypothetical protein [Candidatus Parcubacteria bacterium]
MTAILIAGEDETVYEIYHLLQFLERVCVERPSIAIEPIFNLYPALEFIKSRPWIHSLIVASNTPFTAHLIWRMKLSRITNGNGVPTKIIRAYAPQNRPSHESLQPFGQKLICKNPINWKELHDAFSDVLPLPSVPPSPVYIPMFM